MPLIIDTDTDEPNFDQRVALGSREFVLRFDWNGRENRYYLDVGLTDGTCLVRGWKLVTGVVLGPRVVDDRMPGGLFLVVAPFPLREPPGLGELGKGRRCQLVYYSPAEVLAL